MRPTKPHLHPHGARIELAPQRDVSHRQGVAHDEGAQGQVVVDAIAHGVEVDARDDVAQGVVQPVVDLRGGGGAWGVRRRWGGGWIRADCMHADEVRTCVAPSASEPYSACPLDALLAM
jgi:hypothetical protein